MADAEAVIAGLPERPDVTYVGLVLNERGLDRALETSISEVGCVALTSDTFAGKNQGQTYRESIQVAKKIVSRAIEAGCGANVTISAAFGCPFEGEVPIVRVVEMAEELAEAGPREIALADTIGVGDPWHVEALFEALSKAVPGMPLRAHFHNTRNTGLANAFAAVKSGVTTLDGSVAGIGGCPFAPAATGNVPTEDLLYMLQRNGLATEVSLPALIATAEWLTGAFDRHLPGMLSRAGIFPPAKTESEPLKYEAEMT
jgi:hydroxymethylglutaryl-CoA lyase